MARLEYTLVTGIGTHDFALTITRLINQGWELSGALHVHVDDNGVRFTRELTKVHEHGVPYKDEYGQLKEGFEESSTERKAFYNE
jgi:hypothetical protein